MGLMDLASSGFDVELRNPCVEQKDHCLNCHSHFMEVRPHLKGVVITRRFLKDLRDEKEAKAIVRDVLDCSNADFYELHKFEKHVDGCMVFRAKTKKIHIVYCVDKEMHIIFMRVFKNFKEYEKFLDDNKEISKLITHS
jgi:mRNA-degrading endonuclease RelE of RelBE toxin-antitoxin system